MPQHGCNMDVQALHALAKLHLGFETASRRDLPYKMEQVISMARDNNGA